MTQPPTRRYRAWLITVTLASAAALAGCVDTGEEAGDGDGDTNQTNGGNGGGNGGLGDQPAWEESFTVTENATEVFMNLTVVKQNDSEAEEFEVRLLDENGEQVMSENFTWDEGDTTFANFTFEVGAGNETGTDGNMTDTTNETADDTMGENATAEVTLTPGRYTYQVWSDGRVLVVTDIVVIEPIEAVEE